MNAVSEQVKKYCPKGMTIAGAFSITTPLPNNGNTLLFCFRYVSDPIWIAETLPWRSQFRFTNGKWVELPDDQRLPIAIEIGFNDVPAYKHLEVLPGSVLRKISDKIEEETKSWDDVRRSEYLRVNELYLRLNDKFFRCPKCNGTMLSEVEG